MLFYKHDNGVKNRILFIKLCRLPLDRYLLMNFHQIIQSFPLHVQKNIWAASAYTKINNWRLECGPMPNVMAALPNTGGALCSTPQTLAAAQYLTAMQ